MTAAREALAARVRAALPRDRPVREVTMFGGRSFMVAEAMVVAAGRDGDLLVRVDPTWHQELLAVPGAGPAVMGVDRPMGPRWVTVARDALVADERLAFWVQVGLAHRDGLPRPTDG